MLSVAQPIKATGSSLESRLILYGETKNFEELQKLIEATSTDALTTALSAKLGRNECITFWNYLLEAFNVAGSKRAVIDKRFACAKCLLEGLQREELSYKQTYDLVTRLCQHLHAFPAEQLIEILEHCIDGIRLGDRKYVCWKDLLPEVLNVLAQMPLLRVNGVQMSGGAYRDTTVRNISTMRWPVEIVTPIADMFKELHLNSNELIIVLNKFGGILQSLPPTELPALAFQLFSMCKTATEIMIMILAFEKYFHRFYYKKLFSDMMSNSTDFDSIDAYSDKELREAEETILHHLNYCTQYKISEIQMCVVIRNLTAMPDLMLTPFVISAILSMSTANREPDTKSLSSSALLYFLRSAINNNEHERRLADYSVWCRDALQRKQVQLDYVFSVLIDQNKDGQDVITPGLVTLAFALLKAKSNAPLNAIAMAFLTKFIRKRFVFGQGIVKKLAEWMVVEQDQPQFAECLVMLSVADTFTVSECVKTIKYVMDFFLWIPGEQAMRMMSFILPILKLSAIVRDAFIEVLRKAINSSNQNTRVMAVYGFCMVLKQLNNSNSQRSQMNASGFCTQQSISGYSLMSQATLGNRSNPQRHFDMFTLDVVGLLRNCFANNFSIKRVLYENLQRAVELNPKLVPHVLQFIDWHFRSFFRTSAADSTDADEFTVIFEKLAHTADHNIYEIEIHDNLGYQIQFISHCLVIFEKLENDYDVREIQRLLRLAVQKTISKELKFEEKTDNWTPLKSTMLLQQMNFIEGLMAYSLLTSKPSNDNVKHILPLFRAHHKLQETLKSYAAASKKLPKKSKDVNDAEASANISINGVVMKKFNLHVENVWDLTVIEKMLRLLHEDIVPFASAQHTNALRANEALVRYVLEVAASKMEAIRLEPDYKQLAHSRRTLKYLTDITKVVYERCIRRLPELWRDFDVKTAALASECFQQCLQSANAVYKKKFVDEFLKGFDFHTINRCKQAPVVVQEVIDEYMEETQPATTQTTQPQSGSDSEAADRRRIPCALLQSLEVFYDNIPYEDRLTTDSYSWLLKFCKCYEVNKKELHLVHKLLFSQRQKTHCGPFFHTIALQLCGILGAIIDEQYESECPPAFVLKSLTLDCAESYFNFLCQALRKQIEDVDYFIAKANNLNYKYRLIADDERDLCLSELRSVERSICTQLAHISNALLNLTNACIPLGACMETLLKLLMQHYDCLKNLAKHFLSCAASSNVCVQTTKFDLLLRAVGKPLPQNIYSLISYIEANILDKEHGKKLNAQAERARVIRETKLIPKVVLHLETFNSHVILLAKKTNIRLANLLHQGTVHDYRFRTHTLKAAVDRTFSHSSAIETDPSVEEQTEEDRLLERMEAESAAIESCKDDELDDDDDGSSTKATESGVTVDDDTASERSAPVATTSKAKSRITQKTQKQAKLKKTQKPLNTPKSRKTQKSQKASKSQKPSKTQKSPKTQKTQKSAKSPKPRKSQLRQLRSSSMDETVDSDARATPTPEDEEVLEHESNKESATQLLKNLAQINKRAKKRTLLELEENELPNTTTLPPKKRRGRFTKM